MPHGKGWSPLTWQILEGKNKIPVTLIEAVAEVDSGCIYDQEWLELSGLELVEELRQQQAIATISLCKKFVHDYPQSASSGKPQTGIASFYPRRSPKDSKLDLHQSLEAHFNLLRVVDNERYPAFFEVGGCMFMLNIKNLSV